MSKPTDEELKRIIREAIEHYSHEEVEAELIEAVLPLCENKNEVALLKYWLQGKEKGKFIKELLQRERDKKNTWQTFNSVL